MCLRRIAVWLGGRLRCDAVALYRESSLRDYRNWLEALRG